MDKKAVKILLKTIKSSQDQNLERLLNVTIDDLKRVTQTYLLEQKPVRAVVAPVAKKEVLEQLGFEIKKVN